MDRIALETPREDGTDDSMSTSDVSMEENEIGEPPHQSPKQEESEMNSALESTDEAMSMSDVSDVPMEAYIQPEEGGNLLELRQEIPKPKDRPDESPDFAGYPHWIKPELLLEEIWVKKSVLKGKDDNVTHFTFPTDPSVILREGVWQIPELVTLKDELSQVKMSVDQLPHDLWRSHMERMDIGNSVMSHVTKYFNQEFSSGSWVKFFEIISGFDIIAGEVFTKAKVLSKDELRKMAGDKVAFDTVHLCEAPGAFISALNHYMDNNYHGLLDWNWLATTLNPYHESNHVDNRMTDDRFILKTMDNWTFLEDKTGNILSQQNFNHLIKLKATKLDQVRQEKSGDPESQVYLVTADGSVEDDMNCEINFTEQEAHPMTHLQFAEILAAIKILQKGGSFVLKIYTFLEAATICHLYLLCCLFNCVEMFKPATSREGDSEVYVICLEFLGIESVDSILESKLLPNLENYGKLLAEGKILLPLDSIPKIFIRRIIESAQFFCNYQMKIIRRNLSTFERDTRISNVMEVCREKVAEEWIEWNRIKPLTRKHRMLIGDAVLVREEKFKIDRPSNLDNNRDRILLQNGTDFQKLEAFKMQLWLEDLDDTWSVPKYGVVNWSNYILGPAIEWAPPFTNIRCSRFCYGDLLETREEIREITRKYTSELQEQGLGNMRNHCSGHSIKRVGDSIRKSCDKLKGLKDFEILCFAQHIWDFVSENDFQLQKVVLQKLFDSVKSLPKNKTIFLCRFPLLSRLQNGIISCLASVFEKVIVYGDTRKNVVGILLHKFNGLSASQVETKFSCMSDILQKLYDTEEQYPVAQLVPVDVILDLMPVDVTLRYNTLILCQDLLQIIHVVECTMPPGEMDYDAYDFASPI